MEHIYSKINPTKLLHVIVRDSETRDGRVDILSEVNFLQCSSLKLNKGHTFKPHRHIWKWKKRAIIAQESWIVIRGSVKCIFYDLDNTILAEPVLGPGDASFTLEGGHNYLIMEDNTKVLEYKTGPYEGQKLDKEFI